MGKEITIISLFMFPTKFSPNLSMHLFPFYSLKSCFTRLCFSPLRIELRRSEPEDLETFQNILKAPIVFNAPKDMIVFDTATIEQPLEGANPTLTQEYDEIINRYLARFDKENILARVKVKLIEKLSTGDFQQQEIAKSLGLSIRSLQRKLSAENTSYSELLDDTRHELALSYIKTQAIV